MNREKLARYFSSAKTACGWMLGLQSFATLYYLIVGLMRQSEDKIFSGLFYGSIGAILFWLIKRFYKEYNFKNSSAIFLTYFGLTAMDVGYYLGTDEWSVVGVNLAISIPILFFLGRAAKASIHSNVVFREKESKVIAQNKRTITSKKIS